MDLTASPYATTFRARNVSFQLRQVIREHLWEWALSKRSMFSVKYLSIIETNVNFYHNLSSSGYRILSQLSNFYIFTTHFRDIQF
jgi:hypothetical protein